MANEPRSSDTDKRTGGVTIGNVIGGIHNSIIAGRDVIVQIFTGDTSQQRAQRNRQAMLKLVHDFWVKGVLENSLHGAVLIELGMEERKEAVEHPWDMVLQTPAQPNRTLPAGTKIIDVFDEMGQALLILGEPGSGKTTMLLDLARDTIARTEGNPTQPIPVVFNLSSWAEKRQSIEEWLVEELNTKYNIPRKIARPWVENDELLLLLDGLDEVALEHREACVKVINDCCQEHMMSLVVCSRIADYEALAAYARLRLHGAVLLQALTSQQIDTYLDQVGSELAAVRTTLRGDVTLQELARSPLMLSIMALAYRGMPVEDLQPPGSIETRRKHLFDAYVQQMFNRRGINQQYAPKQTIQWLVWLAQRMTRYNQSIFLIERMQPGWLRTDTQRKLYNISSILIAALTVALAVALILVLIGGLPVGPCGGLLLYLLFISLPFGLGPVLPSIGKDIRTVESLKWSWEEAVKGLSDGLAEAWGGSRHRLGLTQGLIVGLIYGLRGGLNSMEIEKKTTPNQGIFQSAKNAIIVGLAVGLLVGLPVWLIVWSFLLLLGSGLHEKLAVGLLVGLIMGLFGGLGFGLIYGGLAFIQHYTLRFILSLTGQIPWNLARFLDYAAERIFLRKVGGGYIFIHRLLLEHFASLEPEKDW